MQQIEEQFGKEKAIFIKSDVSNIEQLRNAFEQTVLKYGNMDIIINSAGICNDSTWEREVAVNVVRTSTFFMNNVTICCKNNPRAI